MSAATAVAHSNIALVKYWGKADEELHLPAASSLSLTLDCHPTTTTVEFDASLDADVVLLGGQALEGRPRERVVRFLDRVRGMAGLDAPARVTSINTAPTAAGLASSAAGFAALAGAASRAAGLELSERELSILARKGSGSASRSIFGGLVLWNAGHDDASSFAEPLGDGHPDLAMIIAVVNSGQKHVSSGEAMRRTVETSPYFPAWADACTSDLRTMLAAIERDDFTAMGETAESNAMRMHATMLGATPPVRYWESGSVAVLDRVAALRGAGTECYATMDAGPNVKVLCRPADLAAVRAGLAEIVPGEKLIDGLPGPGLLVGPADAAR